MRKLSILVLSIVVLSVMSLGPMLPVRAASSDATPKSAAAGTVDFTVSGYSATYQYTLGGLSLQTTVKSPSGYWPNVIASVNGTNYTLTPQVTLNAAKFNISNGVVFKGLLCGLANGSYTVKFFAKNETGEVGSASNSTVNVQYSDFAGGTFWYSQVHKNVYRFYASNLYWNCSDPISVVLNINGTEIVNMTWNAITNRFEYTKDFLDETKGSFIFNITVTAATYPYIKKSNNITVTLTAVQKYSSITYASIQTTQDSDGNQTEEYYLIYTDWNGTAPQKLNISVNEEHTALPVTVFTKYYALQSINSKKCESIDYYSGGLLGPYKLKLVNGTTYNVTVFAFNGTHWVNMTVKNNITSLIMNPTFTISIVNQTVFLEGGKRKINLTVSVTYLGNDFWMVPNTIDVLYINPKDYRTANTNSYSTWTLNAVNFLDTNMADGKIYSSIEILGDEKDPFYGDIIYKVKIAGILKVLWNFASFLYITAANYTIAGIQTPASEYYLTGGEWFVYDVITTTNSCICPSSESKVRQLSKFSFVGRLFGCDYMSVETYTYDYCYKIWININDQVTSVDFDPFGLGLGSHYCIDSADNESLYEAPILPKNVDLKAYVAYLQDLILPLVDIIKIDGKKITVTQSAYGYEYSESFEMVNGLKKNEVKITKMCCSVTNYKVVQISNGKGALPEGDGSAGIPGYDVPLVLICFGLMSFGIVMAIKRRRVA